MPRRVDFMVIGTHKGGTTALHAYLAEQPAFSVPAAKELHFFDDEAVDWARPDYRAYHRRFAADGWERIVGEATPIYCFWPQSLERIAAYNPAARLVFLLRDPVERAWSHWKMEVARGNERRPFAWCIREGRARLGAGQPEGHRRAFSYVERGFFGGQLERLLGLFPRRQLLILRSEDLRRRPNAALARLSAFLGAPPPQPVRPRLVHVAADIPYGSVLEPADVAYLRSLYAEDDTRLRRLTGISFAAEAAGQPA